MRLTRVLICCLCYFLIAGADITEAQEETPPSQPPRGVQRRQGPPGPKTDAPAPCNISISSLPRFVGVHMGMPYDEVASIYPEIVKDRHFHKTFKEDGSGLFMVQASDLKSPLKDDVVQISLNFKDRNVWIMSLVYEADKWKSVDDAVAELTRLLGVDEKAWKVSHGESAELSCLDFKLGVSSQAGSPRLNSLAIHPLRYTSQ